MKCEICMENEAKYPLDICLLCFTSWQIGAEELRREREERDEEKNVEEPA